MSDGKKGGFLSRARQAVACGVAAVFLYSTVAVPFAQASVWSERRGAAERARNPKKAEPVQLARVPAGMADLTPDHARQLIPDFSNAGRAESFSGRAIPPDAAPSSKPDLEALPAAVRSLPYAYGEIRKVHLAGRTDSPLIVLIRDAHEIETAQRNIAYTLRYLDRQLHPSKEAGGPLIIGVEGSEGAYGLDRFRRLDDRDAARNLADFLLRKSFINGAEYYGLTAEREPILWGVDREDAYLANVAAYRKGRAVDEKARKVFADLQSSLAAIKAKFFSGELAELDGALERFHQGRSGIAQLFAYIQRQPEIREDRFSALARFARLLDAEKSLDLAKVGRQRTELIQELLKRMRKEDLEQLLKMSLSYRLGQIGYATYYGYLRGAMESSGISVRQYPDFDGYVRYVILAEQVDSAQVMEQIEQFKDAAFSRLARQPEQKEVLRLAEALRTVDKLMRYELVPQEWDRYEAQRERILRLPERLKTLCGLAGVPFRLEAVADDYRSMLPVYEDFYRAAARRDGLLVGNLLDRVRLQTERSGRKPEVAVLIAGGFHTSAIEAELERAGAPYVTFMPKLNATAASATQYLDFFSETRTPVEKMLLGDRLFLNPTSGMTDHVFAGFEYLRSILFRVSGEVYVALALFDGAAARKTEGEASSSFGEKVRARELEDKAQGTQHREFMLTLGRGLGTRYVVLVTDLSKEGAEADKVHSAALEDYGLQARTALDGSTLDRRVTILRPAPGLEEAPRRFAELAVLDGRNLWFWSGLSAGILEPASAAAERAVGGVSVVGWGAREFGWESAAPVIGRPAAEAARPALPGLVEERPERTVPPEEVDRMRERLLGEKIEGAGEVLGVAPERSDVVDAGADRLIVRAQGRAYLIRFEGGRARIAARIGNLSGQVGVVFRPGSPSLLYLPSEQGIEIWDVSDFERPKRTGLRTLPGRVLALRPTGSRVVAVSGEGGRLHFADVSSAAGEVRSVNLFSGGEWIVPESAEIPADRPDAVFVTGRGASSGKETVLKLDLQGRIGGVWNASRPAAAPQSAVAHAVIGSGRALWGLSFLGLIVFNAAAALSGGLTGFDLSSFAALNILVLAGIRILGIPFFLICVHEFSHYAAARLLGLSPRYRWPESWTQFIAGFSSVPLSLGVEYEGGGPAARGFVGAVSILATFGVLAGAAAALASISSGLAVTAVLLATAAATLPTLRDDVAPLSRRSAFALFLVLAFVGQIAGLQAQGPRAPPNLNRLGSAFKETYVQPGVAEPAFDGMEVKAEGDGFEVRAGGKTGHYRSPTGLPIRVMQQQANRYLYLLTDAGIEIVDLADPAEPKAVRTIEGDGLMLAGMSLNQDRLFVTGFRVDRTGRRWTAQMRLLAYRCPDPQKLEPIGQERALGGSELASSISGTEGEIVADRTLLAVNRGRGGVDVFDASDPARLRPIDHVARDGADIVIQRVDFAARGSIRAEVHPMVVVGTTDGRFFKYDYEHFANPSRVDLDRDTLRREQARLRMTRTLPPFHIEVPGEERAEAGPPLRLKRIWGNAFAQPPAREPRIPGLEIKAEGSAFTVRSGDRVGRYQSPTGLPIRMMEQQDGRYLYALTNLGVEIVDLADPSAPRRVAELQKDGFVAAGLVVRQGLAVVSGFRTRIAPGETIEMRPYFQAYDVRDPASPRPVGLERELGSWERLEALSDREGEIASVDGALVAFNLGRSGIDVMDFIEPDRPMLKCHLPVDAADMSFAQHDIHGTALLMLWVFTADGRLLAYDLTSPEYPVPSNYSRVAARKIAEVTPDRTLPPMRFDRPAGPPLRLDPTRVPGFRQAGLTEPKMEGISLKAEGGTLSIQAGGKTVQYRTENGKPIRMLEADGSFLYVLSDDGVDIVDLSRPDQPRKVAGLGAGDAIPAGVAVRRGVAWVTGIRLQRPEGLGPLEAQVVLQMYDVRNPQEPKAVGPLRELGAGEPVEALTPASGQVLTVDGSLVVIDRGRSGTDIYDFVDPLRPLLKHHFSQDFRALSLDYRRNISFAENHPFAYFYLLNTYEGPEERYVRYDLQNLQYLNRPMEVWDLPATHRQWSRSSHPVRTLPPLDLEAEIQAPQVRDDNGETAHALIGSGRALWLFSFAGLAVFDALLALATGASGFDFQSFLALNVAALAGIRVLGIPLFILGVHELSHYAVAWGLYALGKVSGRPAYQMPESWAQFFFGFSMTPLTVGVRYETASPAVKGLIGVSSILATFGTLAGLGVALAVGSPAAAVLAALFAAVAATVYTLGDDFWDATHLVPFRPRLAALAALACFAVALAANPQNAQAGGWRFQSYKGGETLTVLPPVGLSGFAQASKEAGYRSYQFYPQGATLTVKEFKTSVDIPKVGEYVTESGKPIRAVEMAPGEFGKQRYGYVVSAPGVDIVDFQNPKSPVRVGGISVPGLDHGSVLLTDRGRGFVSGYAKRKNKDGKWEGRLHIYAYDTSDPARPRALGGSPIGGWEALDAIDYMEGDMVAEQIGGRWLLCVNRGENGVRVLEFSDPNAPGFYSDIPVRAADMGLDVMRGDPRSPNYWWSARLHLFDEAGGSAAYDLKNPLEPKEDPLGGSVLAQPYRRVPHRQFDELGNVPAKSKRGGPRRPNNELYVKQEAELAAKSPDGFRFTVPRRGDVQPQFGALDFFYQKHKYQVRINAEKNQVEVDGGKDRKGSVIERPVEPFIFGRVAGVGNNLYVAGFELRSQQTGGRLVMMGRLAMKIYDLTDPAEPVRKGELVLGEWTPLHRIRPEEGVMIPGRDGLVVVNGGRRGVDLVDASDPRHPIRLSNVPVAYDRIMLEMFYSPGRAANPSIPPIYGTQLHLGPMGRWDISSPRMPYDAYQSTLYAKWRYGGSSFLEPPPYPFVRAVAKDAPAVERVETVQVQSGFPRGAGEVSPQIDPLTVRVKGEDAYRVRIDAKQNRVEIEGLGGRKGAQIERGAEPFVFARAAGDGNFLYVTGFETELQRGTAMGRLVLRVYNIADPSEPAEVGRAELGEWTPVGTIRGAEGTMIALPGGGLVVNGGERGIDLVDCSLPDSPVRLATVPAAYDRILLERVVVAARPKLNLPEYRGLRLHMGAQGIWNIDNFLRPYNMNAWNPSPDNRFGRSSFVEFQPYSFPGAEAAAARPDTGVSVVNPVPLRGDVEPQGEALTVRVKGDDAYRVSISRKDNQVVVQGLKGRKGTALEAGNAPFVFGRVAGEGDVLYVSGFEMQRQRGGLHARLALRTYDLSDPQNPKQLSQTVLGDWEPLDRIRDEEGVMIALPGGRLAVNGGRRGIDLVLCSSPDHPVRTATVPLPYGRMLVQTMYVPARKDASGRTLPEIKGLHLHLGFNGRWNITNFRSPYNMLQATLDGRMRNGRSSVYQPSPYGFNREEEKEERPPEEVRRPPAPPAAQPEARPERLEPAPQQAQPAAPRKEREERQAAAVPLVGNERGGGPDLGARDGGAPVGPVTGPQAGLPHWLWLLPAGAALAGMFYTLRRSDSRRLKRFARRQERSHNVWVEIDWRCLHDHGVRALLLALNPVFNRAFLGRRFETPVRVSVVDNPDLQPGWSADLRAPDAFLLNLSGLQLDLLARSDDAQLGAFPDWEKARPRAERQADLFLGGLQGRINDLLRGLVDQNQDPLPLSPEERAQAAARAETLRARFDQGNLGDHNPFAVNRVALGFEALQAALRRSAEAFDALQAAPGETAPETETQAAPAVTAEAAPAQAPEIPAPAAEASRGIGWLFRWIPAGIGAVVAFFSSFFDRAVLSDFLRDHLRNNLEVRIDPAVLRDYHFATLINGLDAALGRLAPGAPTIVKVIDDPDAPSGYSADPSSVDTYFLNLNGVPVGRLAGEEWAAILPAPAGLAVRASAAAGTREQTALPLETARRVPKSGLEGMGNLWLNNKLTRIRRFLDDLERQDNIRLGEGLELAVDQAAQLDDQHVLLNLGDSIGIFKVHGDEVTLVSRIMGVRPTGLVAQRERDPDTGRSTDWLYVATAEGVRLWNVTDPASPLQTDGFVPMQGKVERIQKIGKRIVAFRFHEGRLDLVDVTFPTLAQTRTLHLRQGREWIRPVEVRVLPDRPGMAYVFGVTPRGRRYWVHLDFSDPKRLPKSPAFIEPVAPAPDTDLQENLAEATIVSGRFLWGLSFLGWGVFGGAMSLLGGFSGLDLSALVGLNALALVGIRVMGIPLFLIGAHELSHYATAALLGLNPSYRWPDSMAQFLIGFSDRPLSMGVRFDRTDEENRALIEASSIVATGGLLAGIGYALVTASSWLALLAFLFAVISATVPTLSRDFRFLRRVRERAAPQAARAAEALAVLIRRMEPEGGNGGNGGRGAPPPSINAVRYDLGNEGISIRRAGGEPLGRIPAPSGAVPADIQTSGGLAYATFFSAPLSAPGGPRVRIFAQIYDVGDPARPILLGETGPVGEAPRASVRRRAGRIQLLDGTLFVNLGRSGIEAVDVSRPGLPRPLGRILEEGDILVRPARIPQTPGAAVPVPARLVIRTAAGERVYDVSNPAAPRPILSSFSGTALPGERRLSRLESPSSLFDLESRQFRFPSPAAGDRPGLAPTEDLGSLGNGPIAALRPEAGSQGVRIADASGHELARILAEGWTPVQAAAEGDRIYVTALTRFRDGQGRDQVSLSVRTYGRGGTPVGESEPIAVMPARAVSVRDGEFQVLDGHVYVRAGASGIGVVDVREPRQPVLVARLPETGPFGVERLSYRQGRETVDLVHVFAPDGGYRRYLVDDPRHPFLVPDSARFGELDREEIEREARAKFAAGENAGSGALRFPDASYRPEAVSAGPAVPASASVPSAAATPALTAEAIATLGPAVPVTRENPAEPASAGVRSGERGAAKSGSPAVPSENGSPGLQPRRTLSLSAEGTVSPASPRAEARAVRPESRNLIEGSPERALPGPSVAASLTIPGAIGPVPAIPGGRISGSRAARTPATASPDFSAGRSSPERAADRTAGVPAEDAFSPAEWPLLVSGGPLAFLSLVRIGPSEGPPASPGRNGREQSSQGFFGVRAEEESAAWLVLGLPLGAAASPDLGLGFSVVSLSAAAGAAPRTAGRVVVQAGSGLRKVLRAIREAAVRFGRALQFLWSGNRLNDAFSRDLSRQLSLSSRALGGRYDQIIPPVTGGLAEFAASDPRAAAAVSRLRRNIALLSVLAQGEAGVEGRLSASPELSRDRSELVRVLEEASLAQYSEPELRDLSARFQELIEGLTELSRRTAEDYQADRKGFRYSEHAVPFALFLGAVRAELPGLADALEPFVRRDVRALGESLSGRSLGNEKLKAFDRMVSWAENAAGQTELANADIRLADVRDDMFGRPAFLERVASYASYDPDLPAAKQPQMLILADDPEAFEQRVRQGAADSKALQNLADALGKTAFVVSVRELRGRGLITANGVVLARPLIVDRFGESAADRGVDIITVNPMLWDLTGLKDSVVQFILWVTRGVTLRASPATALQFIEDHRAFVVNQ